MATYKVIQDIEAEDKLVGPLTLRQFIYACIAAVCAYLSFLAVAKGLSLLLIITIPPMSFTGFFAFPWGRDQPTEVWALAKIRFFLKPRRRIWDQSGVKDLVTVTAPKRPVQVLTDGLSPDQVQSRLVALASTLDTRGWAVKNVSTNLFDPARIGTIPDSDRLVAPSRLPREVPQTDITAGDDMLDEANNPRAARLSEMINASSKSRRQQLVDRLRFSAKSTTSAQQAARPASVVAPPHIPSAQLPAPADYWFLNKPVDLPQPGGAQPSVATASQTLPADPTAGAGQPTGASAAEPTADEEALAEALRERREKASQVVNYQHMKVIQPLGLRAMQAQAAAVQQGRAVSAAPQVTPLANPAKMVLASNDDLNIATIARIANGRDEAPDEVVISLHNHSS